MIKKRLVILFIMIFLMFVFTACIFDSSSSDSGSENLTTLNGTWIEVQESSIEDVSYNDTSRYIMIGTSTSEYTMYTHIGGIPMADFEYSDTSTDMMGNDMEGMEHLTEENITSMEMSMMGAEEIRLYMSDGDQTDSIDLHMESTSTEFGTDGEIDLTLQKVTAIIPLGDDEDNVTYGGSTEYNSSTISVENSELNNDLEILFTKDRDNHEIVDITFEYDENEFDDSTGIYEIYIEATKPNQVALYLTDENDILYIAIIGNVSYSGSTSTITFPTDLENAIFLIKYADITDVEALDKEVETILLAGFDIYFLSGTITIDE